MTDVHTPEQRSYNMSRIHGSRTKPELFLKEALKGLGLRYQPKVYGKPDFASRKHMTAIFVDGCFWHGCPECYREPDSNKKFWRDKIKRNRERDTEVTEKLRSDGWLVIRVWEHELKKTDVRKIIMKKIGL